MTSAAGSRCVRWGALLLALVLGMTGTGAIAAPSVAAGERIYREGVLPDGSPLRGTRSNGGSVDGAAASCTNCHRRSGLGVAEGNVVAPPVTPRYLFAPVNGQSIDPARATSDRERARLPYTAQSLAEAIRHGVGRDGHALNYLMPRFELGDAALADLIAYLKSLPDSPAPGVTDDTIHFATIITPDADPAARTGMLAVLNQFIDDKNAFIRGGRRPLKTVGQIDFRVTRRWQLHVWELTGPSSGWGAQLKAHLAREPVYAVLSGLAGVEWEPVHRFCEDAHLPCLFPNVDAPPVAENDFYNLYLSKGVSLEAELIAARLAEHPPAGRLVQVVRPGDVRGAALLEERAPKGLVRSRVEWPVKDGVAGLPAMLSSLTADDVLVLWLAPDELSTLSKLEPPKGAVYVSGLRGGLDETTLGDAWRKVARMTYLVDLPGARAIRMTYPHNWFRIRHVPVTADKVQSDTYLACGIVSEALNDMLDNFVREFLVERIEVMLGHRQLSGYYPHLGLATGQRFASKGGYLVRFPDERTAAVIADGDWIVP